MTTNASRARTLALNTASWRKSSFSGGGNDCVELAVTPAATGVRDSKNPGGGYLVLPDAARLALLRRVPTAPAA
jgi:hypothetical protein